MNDRELLELAAKAAAYIGKKRLWTAYAGAQPVECTAWNCNVTASFNREGMTAKVGAVWTNYRGFNGRTEQVWFPAEKWEMMPSAEASEACGDLECWSDEICPEGRCAVAAGKCTRGVMASDGSQPE